MDLKLGGRRALITGGSQGIGLAIARLLASEGCHLDLVARSADDLARAADELRQGHGVEVRVHAIDLAERGRAAFDLKVFGYINLSRAFYRQISDLSSYTTGTIITIDGGMANRGSLI